MRGLPEALREHFLSDRYVGRPPGHQFEGEARNAACGDHVVIFLAVEQGRVSAAGFKARGCPASMAMASATCSLLEGLTVDEGLPQAFVARYESALGAPPAAHRHALALCSEALGAALAQG